MIADAGVESVRLTTAQPRAWPSRQCRCGSTPPALRWRAELLGNISELAPTEAQIEVLQITQNRAFFGPGPLPFTGNPKLFRYPTSGYGQHIEAEVVNGALIL